jgi:hypothetical protein
MKAPEGTFSSVSDLTENRGSEQPVISLKIHHGAGFGYRKSPWEERNSTMKATRKRSSTAILALQIMEQNQQ